MFWFIDDVARLQRERSAIDELAQAASWLKGFAWRLDGQTLCVDADIEAHGVLYEVTMAYPAVFPAAPPSVKPRASNRRWSTHQYANGELCLEWGADTWLPDVTGAQMLESAHRLLDVENPLGEENARLLITAPSRHELTAGQELRSEPFRFVSTANLRTYLRTIEAGVYVASLTYLLWQEKSYTLLVAEIQLPAGTWKDNDVPEHLADFAVERTACIARVDKWQPSRGMENLEALLDNFEADLREQLRACIVEASATHLLLIDDSDKLHIIYLPTDTLGGFSIPEVEAHEELSKARTGESAGVFSEAKVAIIGLGSAGSKLAVSLARSGLTNFVLIDDDIVLPENLVRNDLDWRNVGEHKVDAVAGRLKLISPSVKVECRRIRVAGQEANTTTSGALEQLTSCDLIVDATADPAVFNVLAALAYEWSRPLVWLQVFAGGIGGFIARYRPGSDPAPILMRHAFNTFCESTDAPPAAAIDYGITDSAGTFQIATDAEVGVIADHATRFVVDILTKSEPSAFPHSMYLVGLRRDWVFNQPFETIPIEMANVANTVRPEATNEDVAAGVAFVKGLLQAAK